jgi:hypothetical protein
MIQAQKPSPNLSRGAAVPWRSAALLGSNSEEEDERKKSSRGTMTEMSRELVENGKKGVEKMKEDE